MSRSPRHTAAAPGPWVALIEARVVRGLTQADLARQAGISRSYLCDLERGRHRNPSAPVIARLARALRVSPRRLMRPVAA